MSYRVAVIGVGRGGQGIGGHSIGHQHAFTYRDSGMCEIVGLADLSEQNLRACAETFGVQCAHVNYRDMLAEARPEIVSVATYAGSHREIVEACVQAGVRGIWCEKPFTLTMNDGRAMVEACQHNNVKVIINHQRRYLHTFREAKRMLQEGTIGTPVTFLAAIENWDLMEWGTHWLDMFRFFAGDQPVVWVMGQVRCTGARRGYGHAIEEHAVAYFAFEDGTRGILDGGVALKGSFAMRLIGETGLIDILNNGTLRILNDQGWHEIPTRSSIHMPHPEFKNESPWNAALQALIEWIEGGPEPEVSGANGLRSSELYLAAYESALKGDQIDLPLESQSEFPLERIAEQRQFGTQTVS